MCTNCAPSAEAPDASASSAAPDTNALLLAILAELKDVKANQVVFEQRVRPPHPYPLCTALTPLPQTARSPNAPPHFPSIVRRPRLVLFCVLHPCPLHPPSPCLSLCRRPRLPPYLALPRRAQGRLFERVQPARDPHESVPPPPLSTHALTHCATAYPGQVGIHPIALNWGASTPEERGPVVASRHPTSLKVRNAIGAYGGSYSVYKALAAACGLIDPNHKPGESRFGSAGLHCDGGRGDGCGSDKLVLSYSYGDGRCSAIPLCANPTVCTPPTPISLERAFPPLTPLRRRLHQHPTARRHPPQPQLGRQVEDRFA